MISLVYTSCYHVCPTPRSACARPSRSRAQALGADRFSVLTVGFDTRNDTPERMRSYARERGADQPGWHFASADAAGIGTARARRSASPTSPSPKGFDHITQTTIVDARGRIVRQVYGEDFAPPLFVEPLKELVWGQNLDRQHARGVVNTVKLLCTIYDPSSGRYRFDYSLFVSIGAGSLALGIALAGILAASRRLADTVQQ